ncbi:MAG TPA: 4Fe-4S single cluster domain-containing protein [Pseudonocardiaceae bacterium]|nr:4Fe-4S single cluster domain-containing protein [Pseudonocardiaceae bacterium]
MIGPSLRVSRSHFPVTALGPGVRLGVWVQGCPLGCKGCMALDTWSRDGGVDVPVGTLVDRWRDAVDRGATGLTISGGEPLAQPGPLLAFLDAARRIGADVGAEHDILLFTGFQPAELDEEQRRTADRADVLIAGRFDAAAPTRLIWRGSANQAMILQTELGRRRYAAHVDAEPANPPLQVRVDGTGAWLVGVPRPGTLARLDREFRARNLAVDQVSWRPARSDMDGE